MKGTKESEVSEQTDIRTKIEALLGTSKKQNLLVCTCQYGYCPKCYVDYLESLVRASVTLVDALDECRWIKEPTPDETFKRISNKAAVAIDAFAAEVERVKS